MDPSRAISRLRAANAEAAARRSSRQVIFLTTAPEFDENTRATTSRRKTVVGRCAATNLNGTQCNSKASQGCGGFCKRHMPTKEMLDQL